MRASRLATILAALASAAAVAACGEVKDDTPVACLENAVHYETALRKAPRDVELNGGVPISGCLVENQNAGDLAGVGGTMIAVATKLNAAARAEPGGSANLELGYLLGAAQHGADGTEGIHADLIRRLAVAARYSPDGRPLPAEFKRVYREGFDAGHDGG